MTALRTLGIFVLYVAFFVVACALTGCGAGCANRYGLIGCDPRHGRCAVFDSCTGQVESRSLPFPQPSDAPPASPQRRALPDGALKESI